jgi:glyoxylase-like metal-dependent hydrolase (beta-lactamase superfamily II)
MHATSYFRKGANMSSFMGRLGWTFSLAVGPLVPMSACASTTPTGSPDPTSTSTKTITPVTGVADGSFSVTPDFFNTPAAYDLLVAEHGSAQLPFGAYLIGGEEPVLVDAGLGQDFPPTPGVEAGRLLEELAAAGYGPEDINHVVLSHLHADHTGWLATPEGGVTFPNVQVYVGRGDWDDLAELAKKLPAWTVKALQDLHAQSRVTLLDDPLEIVPGVTALPAPGHTRGHTFVSVEGQGPKRLIVGDAVYFPEQLEHLDYSAAHDNDHDIARATRQWLADELKSGSVILAPHFPGLAPLSIGS